MRSARSTPKIDLVTAWKLPTNSNPFFTFRRLIAICKKSFVLLHSSAMHHKTESQNRVEVNPYLTRYISGTRKENDGVNLEQPFDRRSRQGQRVQRFWGADSAVRTEGWSRKFSLFFPEDASITFNLFHRSIPPDYVLTSVTGVSLLKVLCPPPEVRLWWICCRPRPTFAEDSTHTLPDKLPLTQTPILYNTTLFWQLSADSLCRLKPPDQTWKGWNTHGPPLAWSLTLLQVNPRAIFVTCSYRNLIWWKLTFHAKHDFVIQSMIQKKYQFNFLNFKVFVLLLLFADSANFTAHSLTTSVRFLRLRHSPTWCMIV